VIITTFIAPPLLRIVFDNADKKAAAIPPETP
jgi:hypothetical protein